MCYGCMVPYDGGGMMGGWNFDVSLRMMLGAWVTVVCDPGLVMFGAPGFGCCWFRDLILCVFMD